MTWPLSNQVTLDEDESWGYSCLSMIDKETSHEVIMAMVKKMQG